MIKLFHKIARTATSRWQTTRMAEQKIVWVRCVENEIKLSATFSHRMTKFGEFEEEVVGERIFNLNRVVSEPVSETLTRLQFNIWKHSSLASRKKKKLATSAEEGRTLAAKFVLVNLLDSNGQKVEDATTNYNGWMQGGILQINNASYFIERNAPSVTYLDLPSSIISGFPLLPYLTTEFSEPSESEFSWFRVESADTKIAVGHDYLYTPSSEDIGHRLKLVVLPKNGIRTGKSTELVSAATVKAGPEMTGIVERQKSTTHSCTDADR